MITADQIKAARQLLGWSLTDLGAKALRSSSVIDAAESGDATLSTLANIRAALEAAGAKI